MRPEGDEGAQTNVLNRLRHFPLNRLCSSLETPLFHLSVSRMRGGGRISAVLDGPISRECPSAHEDSHEADCISASVSLLLAGCGVEAPPTKQWPAPSRLVSVGKHSLHLHCRGQCGPMLLCETCLIDCY
jgi:hypothetical protein